jgi:isoleucyl-tRNA synthetase
VARYVTRQARWVDFDNDYKTMDLSYMESVLWAFKTLWEKGLDLRGLPRAGRTRGAARRRLSNFETRMDDAYRDRAGPGAHRRVPARRAAMPAARPAAILVWTTTPWTLPSNLALAVGPDIDYAVCSHEVDVRYVLGAAARRLREGARRRRSRSARCAGKDLVGRTYEPLFPYFAGTPNASTCSPATSSTPRTAPASCTWRRASARTTRTSARRTASRSSARRRSHGRLHERGARLGGVHVFDANPIIKVLKERGVVVRHDTYEHNYPHCWRTREPLIYKAISSWFVKVTAFKDRMVEHNQQIRWVPEHVKDGSSASGSRTRATGRSAATASGARRSRCGRATTRSTRASTSTARIAELERDFGVQGHRPAPPVHRRPRAQEPRRPDRQVDDAARARGARLLVRVGLDAVRAGALPVREQASGSRATSRPTSSSSTSRRRAAGSTRCMVLATALFDKPPFRT